MSCNTHEHPERACPFCFDSLAEDYETLAQQRNDLLKARDSACAYLQDKATRAAADERARIVKWLRGEWPPEQRPLHAWEVAEWAADVIERGEHLKPST